MISLSFTYFKLHNPRLSFQTTCKAVESADGAKWKIQTAGRKVVAFQDGKEKDWNGPYYFVQAADIQFGLIERYLEKLPNPGMCKEIKLAEIAIDKINKLSPKPRFVAMCGDLCDAMPDADPKIYEEQVRTFKAIFSKLDPDIPLVCLCGNHDVGDNPTSETVQMYRTNFGDDFFSFWCGGVLYIGLNSQYYINNSGVTMESAEQEVWLDKILLENSGKRIIVFQHIPLFIKSADEEDAGYFSISPGPRKKLLEKLYAAGVRSVFCGHYHRNGGGFFKDMEVVVTSAVGGQLGDDLSGFRLVRVYKENVNHDYYDLDNIPTLVKL